MPSRLVAVLAILAAAALALACGADPPPQAEPAAPATDAAAPDPIADVKDVARADVEVVDEPSEEPADRADERPSGPPARIAAALAEAGVGDAEPGQPTVVLDPGHGGLDVGAQLNRIIERDSNLDMARRVEEILVANGLHVVLTRRDDGRSYLDSRRIDGMDWRSNRPDLQARTDLARYADAAVFVSIHSNGHPDPTTSGVEAWYHPSVYADGANRRLAALMLGRVLAELGAHGYPAPSLGAKDDTCWRQFGSRCRSIYVLSPTIFLQREDVLAAGADPEALGFKDGSSSRYTRGTTMPAALVELLFISHPADAAVLLDGAGRQAMARGVAQGILEFLRERDLWQP